MNNTYLSLAVEYALVLRGTLILMRLMHGTSEYIQLVIAETLIVTGVIIGGRD